MNNPEISIIVPVYKVERYLRQALDSIRSQTLQNWECILVDDGSPDGCGAICDEYANFDGRFVVLHQKNGGLSNARNSGMQIARAPFIVFLDSDDWAEPELYATMLRIAKETGADAVQTGFINEYIGFQRPKNLVRELTLLDRKGVVRELFHDKKLPNYMWNKLFKREVIDTPFPDGGVFEDIYAMNHWAKNINTMALTPEPLYHYRRRRGSIINSRYADNRFQFFERCLERVEMLSELEPDALTPRELNAFKWKNAVTAAKFISRYEADAEKRREVVGRISRMVNDFDSYKDSTLNLKVKMRGYLLKKHPGFFISLMRGVTKFDLQTNHRQKEQYE